MIHIFCLIDFISYVPVPYIKKAIGAIKRAILFVQRWIIWKTDTTKLFCLVTSLQNLATKTIDQD